MATAGDDKIRSLLVQNYTKQGVAPRVARLAAVASHPMDGDAKPASRRLRKKLLRASTRFSKRRHKANPDDVLNLAIGAITVYHELAVRYGDEAYRRRFEDVLQMAHSLKA